VPKIENVQQFLKPPFHDNIILSLVTAAKYGAPPNDIIDTIDNY
jgi:hypothetical protein